MARDKFHQEVKAALEFDGWIIIYEPNSNNKLQWIK